MLLGIGFSQYKISLEILSFFLGLFDVIAQVIIPFAADLSKPQKRGRTVGIILGGFFIIIYILYICHERNFSRNSFSSYYFRSIC